MSLYSIAQHCSKGFQVVDKFLTEQFINSEEKLAVVICKFKQNFDINCRYNKVMNFQEFNLQR